MSCHDVKTKINEGPGAKKVLIVGPPNVGKSVLFNKLTGAYATVSNYPGTTVGLTQGKMKSTFSKDIIIVDTPGAYSLDPITLEEVVMQRIILDGNYDLIIQVIEARNLNRMLYFTLQLMETSVPLIIVLNMMDEAAKRNVMIDAQKLQKVLALPVIPTTAINGDGIEDLRKEILSFLSGESVKQYDSKPVEYGIAMERKIREVQSLLSEGHGMIPVDFLRF